MHSLHRLLVLVGVLLAAGCSLDDGGGPGDGSRHDGGSMGDSAIVDDYESPPDVMSVTDSHDPHIDPDAACAMQTTGTTRAPINLLLVLDRSGSMDMNGKWTAATRGVQRLLDALGDDTRVGLVLFPSQSNSSSASGYSTPAVPIAPLSTSRSQIESLLSRTTPNGGTPMACAMQGSVDYFDNMFTMDGSRNIILITDGEPTEECSGVTCGIFDLNCQANATMYAKTRVVATVASAARHDPPVKTFAVGTSDATATFLSSIAVNGATPRMMGCETSNSCFYALGASTFESDLNAALDAIRGRALTCEFRIMVDTTMADPNLINVNYTPMDGSNPQLIPRDTSHMDGWDYSSDMRSVILYGPTCDHVQMNTSGGHVDILFGCPTITPG
jgi:uncharacterized protein YegL